MNFENFFNNWDTADSYTVLIIALIGFLFGLLIGYLLRSPRIRRLREELDAANQQLDQTRRDIGAMKDQLDQKEADLQRVNYDLVEMTEKVNTLEENRARLNQDLYHSNQEIERIQAENRAFQASVEELNNRLTEQVQQAAEQEHVIETTHLYDHKGEATHQDEDEPTLADDSNMWVPAQGSGQTSVNDTQRRLEQFEAKLSRLEEENQELRAKVEKLHPPITRQVDGADDLVFEIGEIEPIPDIGQAKPVLYERIIVNDIDKDDLTNIKGIGPFLQKKLNDMGVYNYAEIAGWDENKIEEVTRQIAFFPGRIQKDDWVGQAARLQQMKQNSPNVLAAKSTRADDLQVVEGIGPKIEHLLKEAGIETLHDLAEATQEQLHAILQAAGDRYRIHDPATWAQQARLAAEGRWEDLRDWQDKLSGGRI